MLLLVSSVQALSTPLTANSRGRPAHITANSGRWQAPLTANSGGLPAPLTPRSGGWPTTFTLSRGVWPASSGGWGRRQQHRLPPSGLPEQREQRENGLGISREQGPSLGFSQALDYRFPQKRLNAPRKSQTPQTICCHTKTGDEHIIWSLLTP